MAQQNHHQLAADLVKATMATCGAETIVGKLASTVGSLQYKVGELLQEKHMLQLKLNNPTQLIRDLELHAQLHFHAASIADLLYSLIERHELDSNHFEDAKQLLGQAITHLNKGLEQINEQNREEEN